MLAALLAVSLIAVTLALVFCHRHGSVLSTQLALRRAREAQLKIAIDALMELLRNIIDTVQLSGGRAEVLMRDLRSRLVVEIDNDKSLVKDCRLFADLRFNGLADYLERHYPTLNKQEILLCSIISLGVPSDNLRCLLGHNHAGSLYNRTTRIRKKLGITRSGMPLDEYLYQLSLELEKERVEEDYFKIKEK